MCGHLPDTVADMCIDFVEQYGDEIFDMLVKEMAPKEVCSEIGLCAAVHNKLKVLRQEELQMEHVGFPKSCTVCETIVEYLDKLLEDDTIEESIDQLVEKACKIIPSNAQAKVINNTASLILRYLPSHFCSAKVLWTPTVLIFYISWE